jgi:hypothetical protein
MLPVGLLLFALCGPLLPAVPAPANVKVTVFVAHAGEDTLGVSLVGELTSALGRSDTSSVTSNRDEAEVVLFVSTLNPEPSKPGVLTTAAWSLVYVKNQIKVYLGSGLRLTDQGRLARTAAEMAASCDELIRVRRHELPGSVEWKEYESNWKDEVDRFAETLPDDACGVRVRMAVKEELRVILRWSMAAGLKFDVHEIIKSVMADYPTDEEFLKKLQSQTTKLAQCQTELAAVKKSKK